MRLMIQFFSKRTESLRLTVCSLFVLVVISGFAEVDLTKLPPPTSDAVDFARDIQPLLARHCYSCHGSQKQENDLRWDQKLAAMNGGVSGPAIVLRESAKSRMIHLVAGLEPGLVMPKRGERLTPEQIGLLRGWIDQGAPWPDDPREVLPQDGVKNKIAEHWAFKPSARPSVPAVKDKSWPSNTLDHFILTKLESLDLRPSLAADRRTLIRRLSYDLVGLPPAPAAVEEFFHDQDANAYEKLVDRLLASPRYGERWARHWLDTVHFGETHGYDKDKLRPNAWPYRDYVIRAFNSDKPYSRFVEEQLAGDVLHSGDPWATVALGFIAAGPWDFVGHVELPESKMDGLIARYNDRDDMVMNALSTFQSLTVHCARCHNHKFDPISQKDYYSLQAVFAGVDRADRPVDLDSQTGARRATLLAEKKAAELRLQTIEDKVDLLTSPELERLKARQAEMELALAVSKRSQKKSPSNGYHSNIEPTPEVEKWVQVDLGTMRALDEVRLLPARPTDFRDTPGFGFPLRFRIELSNEEFLQEIRVLIDHTSADFPNPGEGAFIVSAKGERARYVRVTATRLWERTKDYVFALAELQTCVNGTNAALGAVVTAHDSIEAGRWSKRYLVDDYDSRGAIDEPREPVDAQAKRKALEAEKDALEAQTRAAFDRLIDPATKSMRDDLRQKLEAIGRDLDALPKPQMVYAAASDFVSQGSFVPAKGIRPIHLLKRGEVNRPAELMMPGALTGIPNLQHAYNCSDPARESSRRAALARWITDPANIMTRRSIVNRVWHYHFGRGLVETPNDFGLMGSPPTHPELLDWLAYWFLDHGESLKQLHRLIVTSATYRQASLVESWQQSNAEGDGKDASGKRFNGSSLRQARTIDADNRYLWCMNRARLDAECIRDSMLAVSGKLDLTMGGPSARQFHFKDDHSPLYDYTQFDVDSPESYRRGIYRFIVRSVTDPFMDTLDCPDPSVLTPKRNTTVTALQALAVLNNPVVIRQAEHLAERLQKMTGAIDGQIKEAYRLVLCRPPTPSEAEKLASYARKHGLANACRLLFNSSEFMFVD